ncbi:MAG: hypothetical protein CVU06_05260 [Bacteroidetes bacterium HGW-Bacteroidetes-22]|nr:MAG: hypothetical protein CVU06_05260 [Bacteroidetes bacterium HGW-Bacteroidetes-22]
MKKLFPVAILALAMILASCDYHGSMISKIEDNEKALSADSTAMPPADKVKAMQALYLEFADKYPNDSISPEYIFRAADLSIFLRDYKTTIGLYDRILTEHKSYAKLPQALFMKAFVYDQYIQDPMQASEFYRQFLRLYPDHELADDATQALLFCGKSDAEIMQILQQRATEDSTSTKATR